MILRNLAALAALPLLSLVHCAAPVASSESAGVTTEAMVAPSHLTFDWSRPNHLRGATLTDSTGVVHGMSVYKNAVRVKEHAKDGTYFTRDYAIVRTDYSTAGQKDVAVTAAASSYANTLIIHMRNRSQEAACVLDGSRVLFGEPARITSYLSDGPTLYRQGTATWAPSSQPIPNTCGAAFGIIMSTDNARAAEAVSWFNPALHEITPAIEADAYYHVLVKPIGAYNPPPPPGPRGPGPTLSSLSLGGGVANAGGMTGAETKKSLTKMAIVGGMTAVGVVTVAWLTGGSSVAVDVATGGAVTVTCAILAQLMMDAVDHDWQQDGGPLPPDGNGVDIYPTSGPGGSIETAPCDTPEAPADGGPQEIPPVEVATGGDEGSTGDGYGPADTGFSDGGGDDGNDYDCGSQALVAIWCH